MQTFSEHECHSNPELWSVTQSSLKPEIDLVYWRYSRINKWREDVYGTVLDMDEDAYCR